MILCIGTTPAAQRVMLFDQLTLDRVNRAAKTVDGAAGKSVNVAKVLHVLGANPVAIGFLGGARGQQIQELLQARGLDTEFVQVTAPTRQCITVIDRATGTITELVEESPAVEPGDYKRLWAVIERRIRQCEAVVLSGTVARGGPPDFYLQCLRLANEHRVLCVADAAGSALLDLLAAQPGLVKPNRPELEATVGHPLPDENAVLDAMRDLHRQGAQRIIITSGSAPALGFDGGRPFRIHPAQVRPLNPIGSGDAFTAAVIWQLLRGAEFPEACRWGAAAGAANTLTFLAGDVQLEEIHRLVAEVKVEPI